MRRRRNPSRRSTPDLRPRPHAAGAAKRIQWLQSKALEYSADERRLWARLLEIGGDAVAPVYEDQAIALLDRGRLFAGSVLMRRGENNECHWNAAVEWWRDPALTLCPGWGLNWDEDGVGCWRQHSFLWDPRKGKIIETTLARHAYFGMELTPSEAEDFAADRDVFGVP